MNQKITPEEVLKQKKGYQLSQPLFRSGRNFLAHSDVSDALSYSSRKVYCHQVIHGTECTFAIYSVVPISSIGNSAIGLNETSVFHQSPLLTDQNENFLIEYIYYR